VTALKDVSVPKLDHVLVIEMITTSHV